MAAGLTVPLGARPSVGAGLWLQGGIGHLARLHGLACDAIVGAVVVSVESGEVLCVGQVPPQHQPTGAVHPKDEADLLSTLKGAGTNFGIVVSVTFKAYAAPTYFVRNWAIPLSNGLEMRHKLRDFDERIASKLPRNCSADAYVYCESDQLHLGVTIFESSTSWLQTPSISSVNSILGPEDSVKVVDSVEVFDSEMYISGMHSGHGGGKTSAFKRCLFLKDVGAENIASILISAVETRPSPFCYLHLLQGGGTIGDISNNATAFGCRDWDFACVITGVWPREQDGTELARGVVQWVYKVANELLPLSNGAYGADLGPDPRDALLASNAFGPNGPRLALLKRRWDPRNVLAYACPLPEVPANQKLIILITGEHGAGKDHCAEVWVSVFNTDTQKRLRACVVSISDACKREYAAATGADLHHLLTDRAYKKQHRPALTAFFHEQVRQRPRLPEEHFLNIVNGAVGVDVLLITGMRDEAPLVAFSHLVPDRKLVEIRVEVGREAQWSCQTAPSSNKDGGVMENNQRTNDDRSSMAALDYRPSLIFHNDKIGNEAAKEFAQRYLFSLGGKNLEQLASMVRHVADFPNPGIHFRHVLNIAQKPGGLALCTSLLETHFNGTWDQVNFVACCEAGGFIFASALAARVNIPLALIREAGKLPSPTVSVDKSLSHISSTISKHSKSTAIEMDQNLIPKGASVLLVDDVLASGTTLLAMLQLLEKAGVHPRNTSVMVVAEFPAHRGREVLHQHGFGGVSIQSLLVFGGA